MKTMGYDAIMWGGTGWNMLWSFGVAQFFMDTGLKSPIKVGSVSGGCMPALTFCGAADQQLGIVQCEQLYNSGDLYFNNKFRPRFREWFEFFAKQDCMEILKEYDFYSTYTKIPSFKIVKDNIHSSRKEFMDKLFAGCHVPFILGINIPIFHKHHYVIDVIDFRKTWWEFPANNTLVISPSEKSSSSNIIAGNLNILTTIGIRGKLTDKDLFLKGYKDAAEWYGNIKRNEAWSLKENWK